MSYIPIMIQRKDPETEVWTDVLPLHALQVNKSGGRESFDAGADQYHPTLTFTLRWCSELEAVAYNPQEHQIVYRGHKFNIVDYDDYMEQHLTVRLVGVAYG